MKSIIFLLVTAALTSCVASDKPNFTEMTQLELDAYNSTAALEERVYCAEVQGHPFGRSTKNVCVTAKDIERASENAAEGQQVHREQAASVPVNNGRLISRD